MNLPVIKTPCVGICSTTSVGGSVCRGCKRYAHEVIDWNSYNHDQKVAIETRLVSLLTTIVRQKILIIDESLLRWQIERQPVQVPEHRNLYCQAFSLLKAGAGQIHQPADFGLAVTADHRHLSVKAICKQIDDEFYDLSLAHYHRYFRKFA